MNKILTVAILATLGTASSSTLAETRINGFASVVAGSVVDGDESLFGYDKGVSFKEESLFALQISSGLGDGLSATAQILSRGSDDFATEFEWAYLSYEINDSTQINAGKLRIPFYRYSDSLDVGYAYTWARPPQTVYDIGFTGYEGISVVNNHTIGNVDSTVQFIYGSFDGSTNVSDNAKLTNLTGVNWTLNYDWFTARAVYVATNTSMSIDGIDNYIDLIGSVSQVDGDNLKAESDSSSFFGIGLSVDYQNILVDAEYTNVEVEDSFLAPNEQYYISVAYRFDTYTVYATTEHSEAYHDDSNISSGLPTELAGLYQAIIQGTESERDSFTAGVRYNFHPTAALKFDYTAFDTFAPSISNENVKNAVFSVGIDLVF